MEEKTHIWEKALLTMAEASAYSGIGLSKLREFLNNEGAFLVTRVGSWKMIKRDALDEFLETSYSI